MGRKRQTVTPQRLDERLLLSEEQMTCPPVSAGYSRKDRSLSVLCENFIQMFAGNSRIYLDTAAERLEVERRRIYDIVNVLEAVGVVTRIAKNEYTWNGTPQTPADAPQRGKSRREKSLAALSRRFLSLLTSKGNEPVLLDEAVDFLEAAENSGTTKTKIRRLYDIANILTSLKVIEKVCVADSRKPAFRYIGNVVQTMKATEKDVVKESPEGKEETRILKPQPVKPHPRRSSPTRNKPLKFSFPSPPPGKKRRKQKSLIQDESMTEENTPPMIAIPGVPFLPLPPLPGFSSNNDPKSVSVYLEQCCKEYVQKYSAWYDAHREANSPS